jgi:hypothetical protein
MAKLPLSPYAANAANAKAIRVLGIEAGSEQGQGPLVLSEEKREGRRKKKKNKLRRSVLDGEEEEGEGEEGGEEEEAGEEKSGAANESDGGASATTAAAAATSTATATAAPKAAATASGSSSSGPEVDSAGIPQAPMMVRAVGCRTPLSEALFYKHINIARGLLQSRGAKPNVRMFDQSTALMVVADEGNDEYLQLLLDFKADVNVFNKYGHCPIMMAAR